MDIAFFVAWRTSLRQSMKEAYYLFMKEVEAQEEGWARMEWSDAMNAKRSSAKLKYRSGQLLALQRSQGTVRSST